MIRKCFGVNEKESRKNKSNFKKQVLSSFFRHYGSERECVWVGVCVRGITAGKS